MMRKSSHILLQHSGQNTEHSGQNTEHSGIANILEFIDFTFQFNMLKEKSRMLAHSGSAFWNSGNFYLKSICYSRIQNVENSPPLRGGPRRSGDPLLSGVPARMVGVDQINAKTRFTT